GAEDGRGRETERRAQHAAAALGIVRRGRVEVPVRLARHQIARECHPGDVAVAPERVRHDPRRGPGGLGVHAGRTIVSSPTGTLVASSTTSATYSPADCAASTRTAI